MHTQSLSGAWRFRESGTDEWLPASVPGSVHTDLLAHGLILDPFVADNELRAQWPGERDWEYSRLFEAEAELLQHERVYLVCDGLDTLAELWLNDQPLGRADNMFHAWRWEVRGELRPGANELRVRFTAPIRYALEHHAQRPLPDVNQTIPGGQYLRKAPCHFGWDWGPKLPSVGVWRDVRLEGNDLARLADVHLRQHHAGGGVTLTARAAVEAWQPKPLRLSLSVTAPDGAAYGSDSAGPGERMAVSISDPQLWWPNGLGAQPLYAVEVQLLDGDRVLDRRAFQVGLRTLELRQEPDEWGRSFMFVVNGVPLFAKGANWIPADSFPARIAPALREHLLTSAARAHHNMVRVWGGGYYEDEHFYDLCDRLGLLVWQDFMFSCAAYPLHDEAFLAGLRDEVAAVVARLRHRACLALWCGNNEMEVGWAGWGWSRPDTADLQAADRRCFYGLLRDWVRESDPDREYWPSSPSSHMPYEQPASNAAGDNHLWEVWHALKPFRHYRDQYPRFASEFGFQSLPALETIAAFAEPADWNMTSPIMEHHQRNIGGNGRIVAYLTQSYRLPRDFAALVYLSQIQQAEAMRTGVEHWRRNWPRCAGALYWQLNDCWPVNSWSSLDYFGRWKALHYFSRRFFAPVLLSIDDDGSRLGVHLANDTLETVHGDVRWRVENMAGEVLESDMVEAEALPLSGQLVVTQDFSDRLPPEARGRLVFVAEFWQEAVFHSRVLAPFLPDKHMQYADPGLQAEVRADEGRLTVTVRASAALARLVEVSLAGVDVVFDDNYFDLPAGAETVVSAPLPAGWDEAQARAALRLRSLFNSF